MNDYSNAEKIKEDFWQRIRPRSKEELEDEEMVVKVKAHFDMLIDDLLKEDVIDCSPNRISKMEKFKQIKQEMDEFILGLNNSE